MEEKVVDALSREPQTPFEISKKIGHDQKTVQTILLDLIAEGEQKVRYKKVGRYRLFWIQNPSRKDERLK